MGSCLNFLLFLVAGVDLPSVTTVELLTHLTPIIAAIVDANNTLSVLCFIKKNVIWTPILTILHLFPNHYTLKLPQ